MTMPASYVELAMPLDMNGMPRCKGSDGVNFGGQCWWIRNSANGTSCKYCALELEKGKEGIVMPAVVPYPKRGGWL